MRDRPDFRLDDVLLAEAARLLEEGGGTLDQSGRASAEASAAGGEFEARLVARARALPAAPTLRAALAHLRGATLLATAAGCVLATTGGAGAVHALLTASAGAPVNVFHALATLLALPTATLFGWLLFVGLGAGLGGGRTAVAGVLGQGVFALAGRLARLLDRGPAQLTMVRAAAHVLGSSGAGRWWASAVSHGLWLAALLGVLAALLLHFGTREYSFNWETTILAERHYLGATRVLAALPDWLGFPVPDAAMVAASSKGFDTAAAGSRKAWAGLLLGCVVAYGVLPRAAALLFSLLAARRATVRIRLDASHPGYARLRPALMPMARQAGIVDADRPAVVDDPAAAAEPPALGEDGPLAVFGLEIDEPAGGWPPPVPGIEWLDMGYVNDRTDRHRVLDGLLAAAGRPRAVLIVCALPVTPDRGHQGFVHDLQRRTGVAVLMLLTGGQRLRARGHPERLETRIDDWRRLARAANVPADRVIEADLDHPTDDGAARLRRWLGAGVGPDPGSAGGRAPATIGPAFALIAEHAGRWSTAPAAPGERDRLALQQAIAALYRGTSGRWPDLLRIRLPDALVERVPDGAGIVSAAERMVSLLPARLQLSPRWLAAGALAGGLGCLAAAALVAPVAIASLPAWAGLGAAVSAVLQQRGARPPAPPAGRDLGEPVAAAALFALVLHLQGRDEAAITRLLDQALGDGEPPSLPDAAGVRAWLGDVQARLDRALQATEVQS